MTLRNLFISLLLIVGVLTSAQRPYQAPYAYESKKGGNKDFNFALFTDLHISTYNEHNSEDLRRAVREVNLDPSIAFVLVSGDITETGDRASLVMAKEMLDKLECKYYIVPGNHETKWSESGSTDFKKIFGDDKFRIQMNGYLFIGVNSGPVFKMGDGHIAPQDITWTARQLKNVGKKMPVFVVTHYPLKTGDVDNWYEYTDVLRKHNVQAVLNGHYHSNSISNYDGILGIINRSVLRAKQSNGGFSLYSMVQDTLHVYEKVIGQTPINWATIPVERKMYVEGDEKLFPRPSFKVNKEFGQVRKTWSKNFGYGIYSAPTVADNKVLFGDDQGVLHCISYEKGKSIWKFPSMSRIISSPAVKDNKVVFGSTDNTIYCLDINTGALLWSLNAKAAVLGSPQIKDGVVYIGASDNKFRAINLETGDELWAFDQLQNYQESQPIVFDNKVLFGAWDSYFYCLDKNNGSLLWKWNNGNTRPHFSPAAVWPVNNDEKVFIVAPDRYMTALDINSGKEVWRSNRYKVRESIGMSEDKNIVFAKTMTDTIIAVDANANEFKPLWVIDAKFGYDHNASSITEKGGKTVLATKNGDIFCLNSLTGEIIWKHKIYNEVVNKIFAVDNNNWILTTTGGHIVRLSDK